MFQDVAKNVRKENIPKIEDMANVVQKRKEIGHWEDNFVLSHKIKQHTKTINKLTVDCICLTKLQVKL